MASLVTCLLKQILESLSGGGMKVVLQQPFSEVRVHYLIHACHLGESPSEYLFVLHNQQVRLLGAELQFIITSALW